VNRIIHFQQQVSEVALEDQHSWQLFRADAKPFALYQTSPDGHSSKNPPAQARLTEAGKQRSLMSGQGTANSLDHQKHPANQRHVTH
jgi:hypothetical protein